MTEKEFKVFFDDNFDSLRSYLYYRSGNSELATDLAQDTFMRIWEKGIEFEDKKTVGLAYKIAGNLFVSRTRRESLELDHMKSLSFEFTNCTPEDEMQYKQLKEKYERALAQMEEKNRVVFLLSRMDELKYHEIAERLDISVKTVEKRMSAALGLLRNVINVLINLLYILILTKEVLLFNLPY